MARKQDLKIRPHAAAHDKKRAVKDSAPVSARRQETRPPVVQRPDPLPAAEEGPRLEEVTKPKRRRRGRSVVWLVFSRLVLVGVLAVGGYALWKNWDKIAPESFVIWVEEKLSGGEGGDGFPVSISGSTVLHMGELEGNLAMLSDTSFTILNSRGGEVVRRPHMYTKPMMETAGKYALVAEANGTRLSLETRAKTEWTQTMKYPIISASVSASGTAAVITSAGQSYSTEIVVFDKKGKEIYRRSRASQAVDVAVSPAGDRIAVISVAAENGALKSSLEVFPLEKSETAVFSHAETGTMLFAVEYLSGGGLAAVGDNALWMANPETGACAKRGYDGQQLLGYAAGGKSAAVVTQPYGSSDGGRLLVVKADGGDGYSTTFDTAYRSVAAGKNGFTLLTDGEVRVMSDNALIGTLTIPSDGRMVTPLGNRIVVLGLTALTQYAAPST